MCELCVATILDKVFVCKAAAVCTLRTKVGQTFSEVTYINSKENQGIRTGKTGVN